MRLNGRTERAYYIQETAMSEIIRNDVGGYYDTIILESGGCTYVAQAPLGTLRTAAAWRVRRIKESDGETQVVWADDTPAFCHAATDLASLNFRDI